MPEWRRTHRQHASIARLVLLTLLGICLALVLARGCIDAPGPGGPGPPHGDTEEVAMMDNDPKHLIVRAWQAGHMSYVEALRRLLDFGVSLDDAIKSLAAAWTEDTEPSEEGLA